MEFAYLERFPRAAGSAGVAIILAPIGITSGIGPLTVALVTLLLPASALLGSAAPRLLYLARGLGGMRPDAFQWRWSIAAVLATTTTIGLLLGEMIDLLGMAAALLNGLYAAGKWGCFRHGCCQAAPYRVVNAVTALPAAEAVVAGLLFFLAVGLLACESSLSAAALGYGGHLSLRLFSYWARGARADLTNLKKAPDIPSLLMIIMALGFAGP